MKPLSLFLDIDGTLLELVAHPDAVTIPVTLPCILQRLDEKLGSALAMTSGRNIATIDRLLCPYRGTAIGIHGIEWREGKGAVCQKSHVPLPHILRIGITDIVAQHPGAFVEDKGSAIAVHERGNAVTASALVDALTVLCNRIAPDWRCLPGHRVVEIKPAGADKGTGLNSIMQLAPFTGTLPVAIGDDITDLDMFAAATRHGGLTVAVGDRIAKDGHLRLRTPAEAIRFLEHWSASDDTQTLADIQALVRYAAAA